MPSRVKVSEIMTSNVFTVTIEDTVYTAEQLMKEENIKHVPVVEGQKIVGMICLDKIREYTLRNIYERDQNYGEIGFNKIIDYEKIMNPIEHVVYPEDSISKAVKLFAKYKLDCLPVVDWDMNLIGIVTHTDILLFFHNYLENIENG